MLDFITRMLSNTFGWVNDLAGGNHFLAATLVAAVAILCRRVPYLIYVMVKNRLTVEIRIKDSAVAEREALIDEIVGGRSASRGLFSRRFIAKLNPTTSQLNVQAGLGWHFVRLDAHIVLVRLMHTEVESGYLRTLDIIAPRWRIDRLESAVAKLAEIDEDVVVEYNVNTSRWSQRTANFGVNGTIKRSRYANQHQLINPEQYQALMAPIKRFMEQPEYFERHGLAHKISILLYGPPGTGKSTLVRHIACRFGIPIISARPSELKQARSSARELGINRAIILLDDIDEFSNEDTGTIAPWNRTGGIGDLITNLDGVTPLDGFIVFINTNDVQLLKSKLYRPGRIDLRMELTYPRPETILENIGFNHDDPRAIYLKESNLLDRLPLSYVAELSRAETLQEVKAVVEGCNTYFKLSESSEVG